MQRIKVVLPAYNEQESLLSLLNRLDFLNSQFQADIEILLVNDGSTDDTLLVASGFKGTIPLKILDLQPNRGLAGALREGFREALKGMGKNDIIVTMDSDDSHNPGLIERMVKQIREGSDLVIASRYRPGSRIVGLNNFRKGLSYCASIMFQTLSPIKGVRDYTCGFRAYRCELLLEAHQYYGDKLIEQKGFACMAELLLKLKRFRPVIHEVPFILRYDWKLGASKMKIFKTVRQTVLLAIQGK